MNGKAARLFLVVCGVLEIGPALRVGARDLSGPARAKPGRSRAVTSADPNPNSNRDRIGIIKSGETAVLADIKGPTVIRHISLTFNEAGPNWIDAAGSAAPNEIVLRMIWDDAAAPAVESPLGDFFGAGSITLNITDRRAATFKDVLNDPGRSARLSTSGFLLNLGLGAEKFIGLGSGGRGEGGLVIGVRAGYMFAPVKGGWELEKMEIAGGPGTAFAGPYIRLIIGAGVR